MPGPWRGTGRGMEWGNNSPFSLCLPDSPVQPPPLPGPQTPLPPPALPGSPAAHLLCPQCCVITGTQLYQDPPPARRAACCASHALVSQLQPTHHSLPPALCRCPRQHPTVTGVGEQPSMCAQVMGLGSSSPALPAPAAGLAHVSFWPPERREGKTRARAPAPPLRGGWKPGASLRVNEAPAVISSEVCRSGCLAGARVCS